MCSALFRTFASLSKAFCIVSLTYNDRITIDSSCLKIVIMSIATCFKNSSSDTLRNSTLLEKNSTVS